MRGKLLEEAKRALSISELWRREGWPGSPGKSCPWPGGGDEGRKNACSIFVATSGKSAGLEVIKNHRTGEVYDAPGLVGAVENLTSADACRRFIELAGVKPLDDGKPTGAKQRKPAPAAKPVPPVAKPSFDHRLLKPRPLEPEEIDAIAITRNVSVGAIQWIVKHASLSAVTISRDVRLPVPLELRPFDCWALHNASWKSFRIRAFVGHLPGFAGHFHKSLTPSGASCSSPVWIGSIDAARVVIVEGEGDAIGAAELIRRERSAEGLAVVVMFSSSIAIPSTFLHRFEGRRVRIVPHCGDSRRQGEAAAVKWASSLKPWAAEIEIFTLAGLETRDGKSVGDLGDLAQCTDELLESLNGVTAW